MILLVVKLSSLMDDSMWIVEAKFVMLYVLTIVL